MSKDKEPMSSNEGPRPVGTPPKAISLTGKLFAWKSMGITKGCPAFVQMPGSDDFYLPCFSDDAELRAEMAWARVEYDGIKCIEDGEEFLQSLPRTVDGHRVRIMIDPERRPDGKMRWAEVLRD